MGWLKRSDKGIQESQLNPCKQKEKKPTINSSGGKLEWLVQQILICQESHLFKPGLLLLTQPNMYLPLEQILILLIMAALI